MKSAAVLTISLFALASASSVVDLGQSLKGLTVATTALLKLVNSTDGTSLTKDLAIEAKSEELNTIIKKSTYLANHLKPRNAVNVQLADGIVKLLTPTEQQTKTICNQLRSKRAGFDAAGVPPFVYAVTKALANSVDSLGEAFVEITPKASLKGAKKLIANFQSDLKICTDAYKDYDYEDQ